MVECTYNLNTQDSEEGRSQQTWEKLNPFKRRDPEFRWPQKRFPASKQPGEVVSLAPQSRRTDITIGNGRYHARYSADPRTWLCRPHGAGLASVQKPRVTMSQRLVSMFQKAAEVGFPARKSLKDDFLQ